MKFNSKEEFIAEAERRGLKEGTPFRCLLDDDDICRNWGWSQLDWAKTYAWIDTNITSYKLFGCQGWAEPIEESQLETPLEDRVKALEDKIKCLEGKEGFGKFFCAEVKEPTQSSRHFIMEGIIEKIYPKDKEKALEALVNIARMELGSLDKPKVFDDYEKELIMCYDGNSFIWLKTKQGLSYWNEIHDLLK